MSLLGDNLPRRAKYSRFNPIRSLTPATLARALDDFDIGHLRQAALLWEVIENRDDVLQIVGPKRRKRVSRRPWNVMPLDDSPAAKKHVEVITDFLNHLTVTEAADENVRGGFRLLVRQMMNAAFHKYSVHEIVWQTVGGKVRATLRWVPLYFFSNTAGKLGYVGPEGAGADGKTLTEGEWMITAGDSAVMAAASICYLFKRLSLQDWLNFSEKFGLPGIHGKTDAAPGSTQWDDFMTALDSFANDFVIGTNRGAEINFLETKQNGDGPFAPMVERMDRRLATLVLGSDLSTMSRENSVGSQPQQADSDQMLEDDIELISETLQTQLIRPLVRYVFGQSVEPLAFVQIQPPVAKDVKSDIEVDKFLLESGGELDAADTFERYDRVPAKTMAEGSVLRKAAAPAPGNQPPSGPDAAAAAAAAAEAAANDSPMDRPPLVPGAAASAVMDRFSRELGVPRGWLQPAADIFAEIESEAARGDLSAEELLAFADRAAARLPELLTADLVLEIARPLETRLAAAALQGAAEGLRTKATLPKAA